LSLISTFMAMIHPPVYFLSYLLPITLPACAACVNENEGPRFF
jgi:hypothetical protein